MIESTIHTFEYDNGEIQRVQRVSFDDWQQLKTCTPTFSPEAYRRVCTLYRDFLVPHCPWIFGKMVLFHVPPEAELPSGFETGSYGSMTDRHRIAAAAFRSCLKVRNGKPVFTDSSVERFYHALEEAGCVEIICGALPKTVILPVGDELGFMSTCRENASLRANAGFFIMDCFDCATVYDVIGTPFGMQVENSRITSPPLFGRETLMVRNNRVSVEAPTLQDMSFTIRGREYRSDVNCRLYARPAHKKTPSGSFTEAVIVGNEVVAVRNSGRTSVPASGFVLSTDAGAEICPGDAVGYGGFDDCSFAAQVGNSIIVDGRKTERFISRFYNIRIPFATPFPPSLYPLDFEKARAPRMVLGEDSLGKPALIWFEGAGKFGYEPGRESCGASLRECGDICVRLGMRNAVNLDGGGSAQIILHGRRELRVSDRNSSDFSEIERGVPRFFYIE